MKDRKGFTLIELMAVVVLVGMIATFAAFFLSTGVNGYLNSKNATEGALNAEGVDCADMPVTIAYDDVARRMTRDVDPSGGTGGDCSGQDASQSWKVYDEDGNSIEETLGASATDPDVGTTTILTTEDICL